MKTILVTGTSQGLGKNIAETFIKNGWHVIGVSRKTSSITHSNYTHISLDLKNTDESKKVFANLSNIDVLVNNASVFKMQQFTDMQEEDINDIIDTNLKSAIFTTKFLLDKINSSGRIFFINSVAGIRDLLAQSIYCASKQGLRAFANVIAEELRPSKIKVTSIHPGGINTPLWNEHNQYPCGDVRDALDPQEISDFIYFICSRNRSIEYKNVTMFPDIEWH
jgi:NADP-dependent 3-hydroxy acid dehydrogenase YdfG